MGVVACKALFPAGKSVVLAFAFLSLEFFMTDNAQRSAAAFVKEVYIG
jgi:hypothetical protein